MDEVRWVCVNCGAHMAKVHMGPGARVQIQEKCRKCGAYNTLDVACPDRSDAHYPSYEKRDTLSSS